MNQLILSNDLNIILAEINSFDLLAGQSLSEIGKRLKHVRDNNLMHGDWIDWVESHTRYSRQTATRLIQAYEQFGATSHHLDSSKIFEMLSLPESVDRADFLAEPHIIPSTGESKQVEDMTVKQLREVTKQLKQAEYVAQQIQAAHDLANTTHAQQQEALLAQIEELKLVKDSPETLKRIAELEAKADREHQLAKENISLMLDKTRMERELAEHITKRDKETQAYSDLRKSLRSIINMVTMEHSNATQNYSLISGHKDAHEAVQDFIKRFDPLVQSIFQTWREAATIAGKEMIIDVGQKGPTNSGVIEITSGEG